MYAIEFQTTMNADGNIAVPLPYRDRLQGMVRVIILSHESSPSPSIIDRLLAQPRPVHNFTPLPREAIYSRAQPEEE